MRVWKSEETSATIVKKKNPENKKDRKEKVRLDQIQKYFGF